MMLLYKICTTFLYCLIYPFVFFKFTQGNLKWLGRLGKLTNLQKSDLWIHAASVGEVRVVGYLIDYLLKEKPTMKIHLTTVTESGFQTAGDLFENKITISFFPLDIPLVVKRTLINIKPTVLVIAETEIWLNLLDEIHKQKIPVILVNGRMTEKAFGRYKIINSTLNKFLPEYDSFFIKTKEDAGRYSYFGIDKSKISIVGDMKFDAPMLPRSEGRRSELRFRFGVGVNDFLFVAGSTRPGEEEIIVELYKHLNKYDNFKVVIAPRHVERSEQLLKEFETIMTIYGEAVQTNKIILINKLGLLNDLYQAADLAFVGGTMVDIGGHNILEPVWAGTPVIYGSSLHNVSESAEYIEKNNFGKKVSTKDDMLSVVESFYLGKQKFNIKNESDNDKSPTTVIGKYIIQRLNDV